MASKPWFDSARNMWYCKYKPDPNGKWVKQPLGKHLTPWSKGRPPQKPPQGVTDRHAQFAEIEYRAKHGLSPAPARAKGLDLYVQDYLAVYRGSREPGSIKHMERYVRRFLEFATLAGITSIAAVSRTTCRTYLEERFKGGAGHDTLVTEKGYLSGIWKQAIEDRLITENPWRNVHPPGAPKKMDWTFWSDAEIRKIAECCFRPWQTDLVLLLGCTGLRISTAMAMAWTWIDWGQSVISIPKGPDIKTQYDHVLGSDARDILERRLIGAGGDTLVFQHPAKHGGIIPTDSARHAIENAVIKAGVKVGTPHDLRHSYARNLVLAGVPITVVQRQLGHTTLSMTMRYCLADEDNVKAALDKLAASRSIQSSQSNPSPQTDS